MISGLEFGNGKTVAKKIELQASAIKGGKLEIWLDDLKTGKLIATMDIKSTGDKNKWKSFSKSIKSVTGKHDLFIKYPIGKAQDIYVKSVIFN